MRGRIFSVQPFCVDDGPGIRTCVYLKGCDMRCAWCHNPESISRRIEASFDEGKCVLCGRCEEHALPERCETGALKVIGRDVDSDEVIADVARDRRYFDKSGGGLTLTGGEPMVQLPFARALLEGAKARGIGTAIETNGAASYADYRSIAGATDYFLIDYKLTDDELHKEMTGRSNACVAENIAALAADGARVVVRCPIIPGVNDTPDHFRAIARLTRDHPVLGFELMPYHAFGAGKLRRLGGEEQRTFDVPGDRAVEGYRSAILSMGGREWGRSI